MRVEYHPDVAQDVAEALWYYDAVSQRLGNEFVKELRRMVAVAAEQPQRFHLVKPEFHRANLRQFPYHFVYRELSDGVRVTLVRHHRRHPSFGMERE